MKNIHPKMNLVKIQLTNGEFIYIKMCTIETEKQLSIDPFNHVAWSKTKKRALHGTALNKFKSRFQ